MSKPVVILLAILFLAAFMAGCTSSSTGSASAPGASEGDKAMATAAADKAHKYAFKLAYGENQTLFSGTVNFISEDGSKKVQFHVDGGLVIDRSVICSEGSPSTGLYKYMRVTFDDSPVNETWDWSHIDYCAKHYFYPSPNETQMDKIRHPTDPTYRRTAALADLNPDKMVVTFTVGSWGNTTYDAAVTFYNTEGQTRSSQAVSGMLMLDRKDMCDSSGKDRYPDMNVTFNDSPIKETWHWGTDYCKPGPHVAWIREDQMAGLKDPRYDLSLFEYENLTGNPVNAIGYCGDTLLGPLVDGHLNLSKTELLKATGDTNCSLKFIGNFTVFEKPYRFNFCGWTLKRSDVLSYGYWALNIGSIVELDFRHASCDTAMSYITPDDPMVKAREQRYLLGKSSDVYHDLDIIRHNMEKEFGYAKDIEQFHYDDWWQLPTEFMSVKMANKGDCEDWAVSFLSLAYAREPTRCWGMRVDFVRPDDSSVEGHVSVFCDVDGVHKIFDQTGTVMEPDLWEEYFKWFDYKGEFTDRGAVRLKPTFVFNNTFYSEVKDVADMYRVLGIKS